uniref:Reverse transcriptase domain-containing protein n=1 Tax=Strongyloides stercoralis TaxID=6248 RepID=A0A0K0ETN6_STRER
MDDIIIITYTNLADHITSLEILLHTTTTNGLKLSKEKSHLLAHKTIFLENHISRNTRKIDESHISKLLNRHRPTTPLQLLSFLQSIQFYREYFRDIHLDIAQLYKFTTTNKHLKHKKLNLPTSAWKNYDNILQELKQNSGLHLYIPEYPIEVHCDASSFDVRAMLCQSVPKHILDSHLNNQHLQAEEILIPLSFFSKSLPPVVKKRCPTYTELYCILYAIRY